MGFRSAQLIVCILYGSFYLTTLYKLKGSIPQGIFINVTY